MLVPTMCQSPTAIRPLPPAARIASIATSASSVISPQPRA
jgi:hypothetical protein